MEKVVIDGSSLTIEQVVAVARDFVLVELSPSCIEKILASRKVVDDLVEKGSAVYGLTTGFGSFKDVAINKDQTAELQKNLIMSHAVGVGEPFSEEVVRAAILIRVNSVIRGYSGVRVDTVNTLLEMLNKKIYPYVPQQGSVGSSGDLAPLSHMLLVLIGLGEVFVDGKLIPGREAMEKKEIVPVVLSSKEGLALNNGTAFMTAVGALAVYDSLNLLKTADISLSLTLEALTGIISAFDERAIITRPHPGQISCAKNVRKLCEGSTLIKTYREVARIQDSYSVRCSPQVHGACRDAINYVQKVIEVELNSTTDNPLVFREGEAISCGNFHGEPIAIAMDTLAIAVAEIGDISERRTSKLIDPANNNGLPIFLIKKDAGGLNSGFLMPQYTSAALVSENKVLAHPASVDSIPTSANQEDHVSMGTIAARKAREIVKNVQNILAIEIMNSVQGIDLREKYTVLGKGTVEAYNFVRKNLKFYDKDRVLYLDMKIMYEIVKKNELVKAVEFVVGKLD